MPHVLKLFCLVLALAGSAGSSAATPVADRARAAVTALQEAGESLAAAEDARDRVQALTETVSAYEQGLMALRSGMRHVAQRKAEISAQLAEKDAETARLLAVLMSLESNGPPVALQHPGGLVGAARGGMLMAGIMPALDARTDDLRDMQAELQALETLQTDAINEMRTGLGNVRAARDMLNAAIAERAPLPKRFTADPVREAILTSSAQTLDAFAENLDQLSAEAIPALSGETPDLKGELPMPVTGTIRHAFGEADAAGVKRAGWVVQTPPAAIVTSPAAASLRYAGPLLDLGLVVILEPQSDVLIVLAGLGAIYGETGDVIAAGAPVGLMSDAQQKTLAETSTVGEWAGLAASETLYIEVREKDTPVDPKSWFRAEQNG